MMTPRQAAAMSRLSSFVDSYATMRGLDPEYVYSVHAGPDGGRSEHIRISDLRTLLAMVAPPPETPPMPESIPLTPEAARVVAAFDAVMDRAGVFEDSNDALAAALRELAAVMERVVPASTSTDWGNGYVYGLLGTIDEVRSIADNIERAITYAETPADGN